MQNDPREQAPEPGSAGPRAFGRGAPGYPARLERLPDPPDRLFVQGRIPEGPMVAIVGSRNADPASRRLAFGLASGCARQGVAVVSGGALGIDTRAHEGALEGGGLTVAVIGSGFDHTYPAGNRELFARIARQGALVTEFAPEQPPARWTFPRRNRIVAALASAVVVVQAGATSGALITARIARELSVPVGAAPGPAGDPASRGNHRLLREGAALVEEAADVLALLGKECGPRQLPLAGVPARAGAPDPGAFSAAERKILDMLGARPIHMDDIAAGAGLDIAATSCAILALELAGAIADQGGKRFVKVG